MSLADVQTLFSDPYIFASFAFGVFVGLQIKWLPTFLQKQSASKELRVLQDSLKEKEREIQDLQTKHIKELESKEREIQVLSKKLYTRVPTPTRWNI